MRFASLLRATARVIKGSNASSRLRPGGIGGKTAITLTPQAITRIKQLLAEQPDMTALKVCFLSLLKLGLYVNCLFRLELKSADAMDLLIH